ncbi:hypothetical protein SCA6_004850 [Theobroma cacao]
MDNRLNVGDLMMVDPLAFYLPVIMSLLMLDVKTMPVTADEIGSMLCFLPISSLAFGGIAPMECKVVQPYSSQISYCYQQKATT